jgi:hypothetical protein
MKNTITPEELLSLLEINSGALGPEGDIDFVEQQRRFFLHSANEEWLSPIVKLLNKYVTGEIDERCWSEISQLLRELLFTCAEKRPQNFLASISPMLQQRKLWTILLPVLGRLQLPEQFPLLENLLDQFPDDQFLMTECMDTIEEIRSTSGGKLLAKIRRAIPASASYLLLRVDELEKRLSTDIREKYDHLISDA